MGRPFILVLWRELHAHAAPATSGQQMGIARGGECAVLVLCVYFDSGRERHLGGVRVCIATERQVLWLTLAHSACSVLFAVTAGPLMRTHGTCGIVMANSAVMVVRIVFSLTVIARFFPGMQLSVALPHPVVLAAFAAAGGGTWLSERRRMLVTSRCVCLCVCVIECVPVCVRVCLCVCVIECV